MRPCAVSNVAVAAMPLTSRGACLQGACSEGDTPPATPPTSTPLKPQQCVVALTAPRGAFLAAPGATLVLSNLAIRLTAAPPEAGVAAALNASAGARIALLNVTVEGKGGDAAALDLDASSALLGGAPPCV